MKVFQRSFNPIWKTGVRIWAVAMLPTCLLAALTISCNKSPPIGNPIEQTASSNGIIATNLILSIHEGMTFGQITKIIPLTTNLRGFAGENGGVWYDVPLSSNVYIQLRFEHPLGRRHANGMTNIIDCFLNFPPRLKERVSGKLLNVETSDAGLP